MIDSGESRDSDGDIIAIFDMDRTITRNGTFSPFLLSTCRRRPWKLFYVPLIIIHMLRYKLGNLSRKQLKERMQGLLIAGTGREEMERYVGDFVGRLVAGCLRPGALAQIRRHREAGHMLVMATASMDYYAAPIGALLGFDLVVATRSTHDETGRLLPAIAGENCYGPPKVDMLQTALDSSSGVTFAYSDHVSDMPLLDWASETGEAIAVNPSAALRRMAVTRGFEIVDWG